MRVAALLALAAALAACGSPTGGRPATSSTLLTTTTVVAGTSASGTTGPSTVSTTSSTSSTTSSTSSTTSTTTTTQPYGGTTLPGNPAGALPQTDALPSSRSTQFNQEMADLWSAVKSGSLVTAMPAFFPEAAYAQLKAIAYPTGDWRWRLVADFQLDIEAAHQYLGAGASSAHLLYVAVADADANWIPPDNCYNSIGYWHVPEARIVYTEGGAERSIGIASLISWRGQWYVVHLGSVDRASAVGIVDDPEPGEGPIGQAGGC